MAENRPSYRSSEIENSLLLFELRRERPLLVLSHFILHLNIDQAYHSQASRILSCSAHTAVIKYGVVAIRLMAPNGFYVAVHLSSVPNW